jgi:two-component system phosphate regulon response regulator PhoB
MSRPILIVDDEQDLLDLIGHHLEEAGFQTLRATGGRDALRLAAAHQPAAILLDIMLPDIQGTEVLRQLRRDPATSAVPILFLTAKGTEMDRVIGFELGADDYVVKPFSPRELALRVRALVRRSSGSAQDTEPAIVRGAIEADRARHLVFVAGEPVALTPTEFRLLTYLMERPGRVVSRQKILDNVWGSDVFVTDRTVDTHVKRLRTKLGECADMIETVRGVGYRLSE